MNFRNKTKEILLLDYLSWLDYRQEDDCKQTSGCRMVQATGLLDVHDVGDSKYMDSKAEYLNPEWCLR